MDTEPTSPVTNLPAEHEVPNASAPRTPAQLSKQRHASWGAIIIIVLILAMVIVGAFYALGKRISQDQTVPATTTTN